MTMLSNDIKAQVSQIDATHIAIVTYHAILKQCIGMDGMLLTIPRHICFVLLINRAISSG